MCFYFSGLALCIWISELTVEELNLSQIVVNFFQVPTAIWVMFWCFLYIFHEFVIGLENMYQVHYMFGLFGFIFLPVPYSVPCSHVYIYILWYTYICTDCSDCIYMTFSSFAASYHRRWDRNNPTDAMAAAGWRRQKRGHVNKLCLVAKKLSQKNMKHPIIHVVCAKWMYSGLFE